MPLANNTRTEWVSYLRVSTQEQAEKDLSLPAQRHAVADYAARHNVVIAREYEEAGSGQDAQRPAFRRMLEDALRTNSTVAAIVVHHSSRFTRDATEARVIKSKLRRLGVRVLYVCQDVPNDPTGVLLEGIFELIDQYESQINGVRTAAAMREAVRQGFFPGARPPYGFCLRAVEPRPGVTRKMLVPDEHEAEVVRELFRLYVTENGAKTTARILNQRGHRYREMPWNKALVLGVIGESAVMGTYRWGRMTTRNRVRRPETEWLSLRVEPIVDRTVHDLAQVLRRRREPTRRLGRPSAVGHLLTGVVRCGHCNASYQIETSGKGARQGVYKYRYYNCRLSCRAGKEVCSGWRISTSELDAAVTSFLARAICKPDRIEALAAILGNGDDRSGYHRKVEQLSKKRREVEAQLEAWELAQRGECAAAARANERIADLCDHLRQLDVELESAHTREASLVSVASMPTVRLAEILRILIRTNRQVARTYLEHLVERLEVHAGVIIVVPKAPAEESAPT